MTILTSGSWGVQWPRLPNRASGGAEGTLMNAANEAQHLTGYVSIPGGGSKTISAAGGGSIVFHSRSSSNVFSNASTTVRIGIQDGDLTASPAQGDGTFDVYADLVGGTDPWSNDTTYNVVMESGTKTISDGQLITIAMVMTSRGGTDAVGTYNWANEVLDGTLKSILPVNAQYQGTWATAASASWAAIIFNDGTVGWIRGAVWLSNAPTVTYSSSSDPDEYGNIFTPTQTVKAVSVFAVVGMASAASDFDLCVYSSPFNSTPTSIETLSFDATAYYVSTSHRHIEYMLSTPLTMTASTSYAVTVRPSTTNNVVLPFMDFYNTKFLDQWTPGQHCYSIERTDNTGAFTDYNSEGAKTRRAYCGFRLSGFDDGV